MLPAFFSSPAFCLAHLYPHHLPLLCWVCTMSQTQKVRLEHIKQKYNAPRLCLVCLPSHDHRQGTCRNTVITSPMIVVHLPHKFENNPKRKTSVCLCVRKTMHGKSATVFVVLFAMYSKSEWCREACKALGFVPGIGAFHKKTSCLN